LLTRETVKALGYIKKPPNSDLRRRVVAGRCPRPPYLFPRKPGASVTHTYDATRGRVDASGRISEFVASNPQGFAALVAAAPEIPKWKIIAFKPALGFDFVHEYGDLTLDPSKLWFLPLRAKSDPKILGLRVGIPNYDESNVEKAENSMWIILDTGLGEQVCAERIGHLEVVTLPAKPEDEGFIGMPDLSDYIAWLDGTNNGQAGGPQPPTRSDAKFE
jgi:hypothetical protein